MKSHLNLNYTVRPEHLFCLLLQIKRKANKMLCLQASALMLLLCMLIWAQGHRVRSGRHLADIKLFSVHNHDPRDTDWLQMQLFVRSIKFDISQSLQNHCFFCSTSSPTSCKHECVILIWCFLVSVKNERCCVMNCNQVSPQEPLSLQLR